MRIILEWLEKAKEDGYEWADAAISNYIREWGSTTLPAAVMRENLIDALSCAFRWENSHEGYDYWDGVSKSLRTDEEMDKFPSTINAVDPTIAELITRYENAKSKLNTLQPDTSLREPFRQAAFKVYKNSYANEVEELAQQIAERIGFWDKYNSLQKELETCKKTSEEVHNLYIDEVKKNFENIHIISQLEKKLDSVTQQYEGYREGSDAMTRDLEKEIAFLKNRRVVEGWIVQNEDKTYSIIAAPTIYKDDGRWIYNQAHNPPDWVDVPENNLKEFNCKIPKWEDEEPTPIYK